MERQGESHFTDEEPDGQAEKADLKVTFISSYQYFLGLFQGFSYFTEGISASTAFACSRLPPTLLPLHGNRDPSQSQLSFIEGLHVQTLC